MQLGMVGLGRMGANMVKRLTKGGHQCFVFDLDAKRVKEFEGQGIGGATTLDGLVSKLQKPRVVWTMVPSGNATESTISELSKWLESGDIIIDGGHDRPAPFARILHKAGELGEVLVFD